jgi:putative toxin-antitoxin system antitoxin component (TIGR02293 family)
MFAQALPANAYVAYRARLAALLQIPVDTSEQEIHRLIKVGFPATTLKTLCELGQIGPTECDQILSRKTLATLLSREQRLTVGESDQLFRLIHVIAMAEALFGNEEKAKRWLCKVKTELSGQSPMAMLSTSLGTRRVEEMLIQAAEGFAF